MRTAISDAVYSTFTLCYWKLEKSQHTDFNEDTTNESASVACSNIRLWKLDFQKEWRNTSWRFSDESTEKDSAGFVDSK